MRGHLLADSLGQVVPDVPPVAYLHRMRQGTADRLCVSGRAVPAHDLDTRMVTQPGFQGVGGTTGQDIDPLAGLGVDQNGRVVVAATQREVVHPQHPRHPPGGQRQPHQRAQGGVP